jgi:hypothetical protein
MLHSVTELGVILRKAFERHEHQKQDGRDSLSLFRCKHRDRSTWYLSVVSILAAIHLLHTKTELKQLCTTGLAFASLNVWHEYRTRISLRP